MKARIQNNTPKKILGFMLNDEQTELLQGVCAELKAEFIKTGREDVGHSPAELLGEKVSACTDESYPEPKEPLIMLAGFDRKSLDTALDLMKAVGLRIPLKAIYTPHNRLWSLAHLANELSAEHKAMQGGDAK